MIISKNSDPYPFISVIITCFNYENFVSEAIISAVSQSYPNKEVVVVDDLSTDGSVLMIKEHLENIRLIINNTENHGPLNSCMLGLKSCKGDFILFLDADDLLADGALEVIANNCKPDVSKIQFPLVPIDKNGQVIGEEFPKIPVGKSSRDFIESIERVGYYNSPPTSGNVFNKNIFSIIGEISYDRAVDGITLLIAPYLGQVVTLKSQGFYRVHSSNISSFYSAAPEKFSFDIERFINRHNHLNDLLQSNGLKRECNKRPEQFAYFHERRFLFDVTRRSRKSIFTLFNLLYCLKKENASLIKVSVYFVWGILACLLPLRAGIIAMRTNPWNRNLYIKRAKVLFHRHWNQ